jgi:hypothetical protein
MKLLIEYGCDQAQGYHFSRPLPAEDLLAWLARSPFGCERNLTGQPPTLSLVAKEPCVPAERAPQPAKRASRPA